MVGLFVCLLDVLGWCWPQLGSLKDPKREHYRVLASDVNSGTKKELISLKGALWAVKPVCPRWIPKVLSFSTSPTNYLPLFNKLVLDER